MLEVRIEEGVLMARRQTAKQRAAQERFKRAAKQCKGKRLSAFKSCMRSKLKRR